MKNESEHKRDIYHIHDKSYKKLYFKHLRLFGGVKYVYNSIYWFTRRSTFRFEWK